MPVWFEAGIPQSWSWSLLAPYISECPTNSKRLVWQNFPGLKVLNQPNSAGINATQTGLGEPTGFGISAPSSENAAKAANDFCVNRTKTGKICQSSISQNKSIPLSFPGRKAPLEWEDLWKTVGPNNSYITTTIAGSAHFVVWVSQLNTTYSPLENVTRKDGLNYGQMIQPDVSTFKGIHLSIALCS